MDRLLVGVVKFPPNGCPVFECVGLIGDGPFRNTALEYIRQFCSEPPYVHNHPAGFWCVSQRVFETDDPAKVPLRNSTSCSNKVAFFTPFGPSHRLGQKSLKYPRSSFQIQMSRSMGRDESDTHISAGKFNARFVETFPFPALKGVDLQDLEYKMCFGYRTSITSSQK